MEEVIAALRQNVEDGLLSQEFVDQLIEELTGEKILERTMEDHKLECYKYKMGEKFMRENEYPVYPEDDGYDTFKNPYSPV